MKYDAEVSRAIQQWAPAFGVSIDPKLVHAVIQRESSHVALETAEPGGRHSYGPMMVLDTTARGWGVDPVSLKDPARGIWFGVRYLAEQLARFPGDVPRALAAYNAGPGNANRNAKGKFPNQAYVDAVLGWWRVYGGGAVGAVGVAIGVAVGLWLLARSRRRGAR